MRRLIWIIPLVLLVGLLALTQVLLWDSSGNLPAVIAGNRTPDIDLDPDVSTNPDPTATPYAVTGRVDTARAVGQVDPGYLSFAIDTSSLVGGKWWDPNAESTEAGSGTVNAPLFDFDRPPLDVLASALAPAYLRIGGSEADKVFYAVGEYAGATQAPAGYESVLTPDQWDAAIRFAERTGLDVVFTLNAGPGNRDDEGVWQPGQAEALIRYAADNGQDVHTWELGNELNLYWYVHGLGERVSTQQYGDDLRALRGLAAELTPDAAVSGQGSAYWPVLGEPLGVLFGFTEGYLAEAGADTATVSWHYYPQQSRRGPIATKRAHPARLLDPDNLDEAAHWADQVTALRDEYSPGTPVWLGETGNAQFGGEPGLSDSYLGSLWWLDQLGLLARHEHDVVVRQTLAGSNYQLIDNDTLEPLPDYWASLLWRQLMGTDVLTTTVEPALDSSGHADTDSDQAARLRLYAHRSADGAADGPAVTVLAINLDPQRPARLTLPDFAGQASERYRLTGPDLFGTTIRLNERDLTFDGSRLPELSGSTEPADEQPTLTVNPLSMTFAVFARP